MKVHHVDCGTMCPWSAPLVNGSGSWCERGKMVCHCLIVETSDGLALVDTGLGTRDIEDPSRLGWGFRAATHPVLQRDQTALARVERLGFRAKDVRHVIPTHLDVDHAGGISDFPHASIHIFEPELRAATERPTAGERARYRVAQLSHDPHWVRHSSTEGGDSWLGFERIQLLGPDLALIPLLGHTRGHCGVLVRGPEGWLLHGGDAYFFRGEVDPSPEKLPTPKGIELFQSLAAIDNKLRRANQRRLRDLRRDHSGEVRVFSAHDPVELAAFTAS